VFIQKQIVTSDGRWFSTRIMPYRTFDDRIDGLVITFFNISDHKHLEVELNETRQLHSLLLNLSTDIIVKLSTDWKILGYNTEAEKFFNKKREAVLNQDYLQIFIPEANQKKTKNDLNRLLNDGDVTTYQMAVVDADGNLHDIEWSVSVLLNALKIPTGMILIAKNITK
jgi:two-component system CheB/CheR fusion protein